MTSTAASALDGTGPGAWPDTAENVVFLVDASNTTEQELLHRWIDAGRPSGLASAEMVVADATRGSVRSPAAWTFDPASTATVVPVRISWGPADLRRSGPRVRDLLVGDPHHPNGLVARYLAARHPERARPVAGRPATVESLWERYERSHPAPESRRDESFTDFVVRMAGIALDVHERRLEGRRYKVPRSPIAGVTHRPAYRRAIERLAAVEARPVSAVAEECRTYLGEIAATPTPFFIDWTGTISGWIVSLGYRELVVDADNLAAVRDLVRDHPSAFLFTHKSHVDGIALISVLYENDIASPLQLGGINMAFRGLASLARRGGTIFIRRTFADNEAYKTALQQYLGYLMEKRFPVSWAFEGTRSRTGKLMPPRFGILKYVAEAAHAAGTTDLQFVPVAINYDLIGDVEDYGRQEAGLPKRAESMGWFLSYLRGLRNPMGRLYLDFGEPVVFDGTAVSEDDLGLPDVAFEVARRVNALAPVTLPALLCMVLLGHGSTAMTIDQLDDEMRQVLAWLRERGIRMAGSFDESDAAELEELADLTFDRGLIERFDRGPTTVFSIRDDQVPTASYYRNTIVHYFVDKGIAEIALLAAAEVEPEQRLETFWREARAMRDLLKFEFFHSSTEDFVAALETELERADPDWRSTFAGSREELHGLLQGMAPLVAPATLQPFLEGYWIVADRLAAIPPTETLSGDDAIEKALAAGEQLRRQGIVTSRAAIGKQLFRGAHSLLQHRGLLDPGDDAATRRRDAADELRRLTDVAIALRRFGRDDPIREAGR